LTNSGFVHPVQTLVGRLESIDVIRSVSGGLVPWRR
jgi:hypothetical protein